MDYPKTDDEWVKLAECIVTRQTRVTPETVGYLTAEATAVIFSWYKGDERYKALDNRQYARERLIGLAKEAGCLEEREELKMSGRMIEVPLGRPSPKTYGEWAYTKVGDTEVRGRQVSSGVEIQHVSGQFDQTDFDAAVKIIEARLSESGYVAPGRPPFPVTYGDWVSLAEDIKERIPGDPATIATVNYQLNTIAIGESGVDEAKRWLTAKAGELGIK